MCGGGYHKVSALHITRRTIVARVGREVGTPAMAYVHTRIRTGRETRDLGHGPWNMRGGTWDLGPGTRDMRHGTRDMRLGTRDLRCVGIQAIIMYTDGAPSNDADMWGKEGAGL